VYAIDRRIYGAYIEAICWLAVAFLFHYASLFYLLAGLLIEFRIRLWFMLFIWVALSTLIMITGSAYVIDTASWFLNLTGWFPQYRTYVDAVGALEYETGFKLHWFLFSAIPILIVAIAYKCGARLSTEGRYVLNLYIAILIIHVFLFGFAYSDRVAIMAWILWPYIINPSAFTSGFIRKALNWYVILMTKVILLVIAMAMFIFHLGLI